MIIAGKGILVDTASYAIRLEDCCDIVAYGRGKKAFILGRYWPEEYADHVFRELQGAAVEGKAAYILPESNIRAGGNNAEP